MDKMLKDCKRILEPRQMWPQEEVSSCRSHKGSCSPLIAQNSITLEWAPVNLLAKPTTFTSQMNIKLGLQVRWMHFVTIYPPLFRKYDAHGTWKARKMAHCSISICVITTTLNQWFTNWQGSFNKKCDIKIVICQIYLLIRDLQYPPHVFWLL